MALPRATTRPRDRVVSSSRLASSGSAGRQGTSFHKLVTSVCIPVTLQADTLHARVAALRHCKNHTEKYRRNSERPAAPL